MAGAWQRAELPPWVIVLAFLGGCSGDQASLLDGTPEVDAGELVSALEARGHVGINVRLGGDGTDGTPWFSRILGARVGAGGTLIVVATDEAPFVHVFRNGERVARFMEQGDGPGEARRVNGVGLSFEHDRVAVAHDGRLSVFTVTGTFSGAFAFESIRPLHVTSGCEGNWHVIAADRDHGLPRPVVHRLPSLPEGGIRPYPVLLDPTDVVDVVPPGGPAHIHRTSGGLAVQYGYSDGPFVAEVDCGDGEVSRHPHPHTDAILSRLHRIASATAGALGDGRTAEISYNPASRLSAGFLALDGLTILPELWIQPLGFADLQYWTEIAVFDGNRPLHRLRVPDWLVIHDFDPEGGVLVSTLTPYPVLHLIDPDAWRRWVTAPDELER